MKRLAWILLVVAASSMIYQFAIIAALTFILGDGQVLFCLFTGTFLTSMGLGAYFSSRWSFSEGRFFRGQIFLAIAGILILPLIFWIYSCLMARHETASLASSAMISAVMWPLGLASEMLFGILIGMQLPLLQIIAKEKFHQHMSLSKILALDYIGSFLGAAAFPLVLFPMLGLFKTNFIAALLNTLVAGVSLTKYKDKKIALVLILFAVVLICIGASAKLEIFFDGIIYD